MAAFWFWFWVTGLVQGSLVVVPMWVSFISATEDGSFRFWFWVWVTGQVQGSLVVVPMWVSFTSATEDGSSGFGFWVWMPHCRGGGLLLLVLGDWPSARVARCRSDVGFFYIRQRGWFFWVRILGLAATL